MMGNIARSGSTVNSGARKSLKALSLVPFFARAASGASERVCVNPVESISVNGHRACFRLFLIPGAEPNFHLTHRTRLREAGVANRGSEEIHGWD